MAASFKVLELRKSLKVPEIDGIGMIAPILPNPVFFDVIGDELEFDDCMFDMK